MICCRFYFKTNIGGGMKKRMKGNENQKKDMDLGKPQLSGF